MGGTYGPEKREEIWRAWLEEDSVAATARRCGVNWHTVELVIRERAAAGEKKKEKLMSGLDEDWNAAALALDGGLVEELNRRYVAELFHPKRLKEASVSQIATALRCVNTLFPPAPAPEKDPLVVPRAPGGPGYHMDAMLIADGFAPVRRDVLAGGHAEYLLPGGRGSTKSSFVSLVVIELLLRNPGLHVLALRQVAATLRDSVAAQLRWAIEAQGLEDWFEWRASGPELVFKPTGQRIYFRGADDPVKIKGLKPPFGAIGVVWFEEYSQFEGEAAVRSIEQTALRGMRKEEGTQAKTWVFKTFNPPQHKSHWVNRAAREERAGRMVFHTTYKSVPPDWLGDAFLERAAHLAESDMAAYEHEYLGEANLAGGEVFRNLVAKRIDDKEILALERVYNGCDWGWYPDPWAFVRVGYQAAQGRLLVFDEAGGRRLSNSETAALVRCVVPPDEAVVCDSADPKSISDWRAEGIKAQKAAKGPGSLAYSYKWLCSLREIVIDPDRCPRTLAEFEGCEYLLGADGHPTGEVPDRDNHFIDAVRYATERVWKRRGH